MFGRRESQPDNHLTDDLLSAYIDGQVTAAERARVKAHLAGCPSCAGELRALQATVDLLREMPPAPLPRAFTIPADAASPSAGPTWWDALTRGWGYRALQGATALAMTLLMTLCAGDMLLQTLPAMAPLAGAPAAAPTRAPDEGLLAVAPTATPAPLAREATGQATATNRGVATPTAPSAWKGAHGTQTPRVAGGAVPETAVPAQPPSPPRPSPTLAPPGTGRVQAVSSPPAATPAVDMAATPTGGAAPTAVARACQPSPAPPLGPEVVAQPSPGLARLAVCGVESALLIVVMGLLIVTGVAWFARRRGT